MRQFGLIGFPLSHSFSPAYFAAKFTRENITGCTYNSFPIETIGSLTKLIVDRTNLEGLNITIPYKKQVIPFLEDCTAAVRQTGACNCVKIKNGLLYGYNTDVIGFESSFMPYRKPHHTKALVLGTGGAAAAVAYVLQRHNIDFLLVSRSGSAVDGSISYQQVKQQMLEGYTVIINTTPLGMFPNVDDCPNIPYQYLTHEYYLYDLVYNPAETLFLKKGINQGAIVKNGADMLAIQAEESWRIWNGEE